MKLTVVRLPFGDKWISIHFMPYPALQASIRALFLFIKKILDHKWPGISGFNLRSSHTKDSKNCT